MGVDGEAVLLCWRSLLNRAVGSLRRWRVEFRPGWHAVCVHVLCLVLTCFAAGCSYETVRVFQQNVSPALRVFSGSTVSVALVSLRFDLEHLCVPAVAVVPLFLADAVRWALTPPRFHRVPLVVI